MSERTTFIWIAGFLGAVAGTALACYLYSFGRAPVAAVVFVGMFAAVGTTGIAFGLLSSVSRKVSITKSILKTIVNQDDSDIPPE